jgi:hypothetical protein
VGLLGRDVLVVIRERIQRNKERVNVVVSFLHGHHVLFSFLEFGWKEDSPIDSDRESTVASTNQNGH